MAVIHTRHVSTFYIAHGFFPTYTRAPPLRSLRHLVFFIQVFACFVPLSFSRHAAFFAVQGSKKAYLHTGMLRSTGNGSGSGEVGRGNAAGEQAACF